jgi:predicted dienelactone hydrolase
MLRKQLLIIGIILFLTACSEKPYIDSLRKEKVSFISREFVDSQRERTLPTKIWYPADPETIETPRTYDAGQRGYTAKDEPISAAQKRYPLVLFSHGTGGSNADLAWLAEILASNGYIVAAPNHWNNTAGNNLESGIVRLWDRPKDLSLILDQLLSDQEWGQRISTQQIAAAGFSAGGFTVLGLAGAEYSMEAMNNYCKNNPTERDCSLTKGFNWEEINISDDHLSYKDDRIRAALSMAPAVGRGINARSLQSISIPMVIASARDDEWLPYQGNAKYYTDNIPSASGLVFRHGGHFLFMQECSLIRKIVVRLFIDDDICGEYSTIDRHKLQHETAEATIALFGGVFNPS